MSITVFRDGLPLRFAGATANQRFEEWVEQHHCEAWEEYEASLGLLEWDGLVEFLEHEGRDDIISEFEKGKVERG